MTDIEKEMKKAFEAVTVRRSKSTAWRDMMEMFAITLSNQLAPGPFIQVREDRYFDIIRNYTKEELGSAATFMAGIAAAYEENTSQDFLGKMYMLLDISNKDLAQCFSPYDVAELNTRLATQDGSMILEAIRGRGYVSFADVTGSGSGTMMIAAANRVKEVCENAGIEDWQTKGVYFMEDLDATCAYMSFIQFTVMGLPAAIKIGNALTAPMAEDDIIDEAYWFTPAYVKMCMEDASLQL